MSSLGCVITAEDAGQDFVILSFQRLLFRKVDKGKNERGGWTDVGQSFSILHEMPSHNRLLLYEPTRADFYMHM